MKWGVVQCNSSGTTVIDFTDLGLTNHTDASYVISLTLEYFTGGVGYEETNPTAHSITTTGFTVRHEASNHYNIHFQTIGAV
jgi:hypothetical protein